MSEIVEIIEKPRHFIRQIIEDDLASGKHQSIATRFPPEPNGYLHIGHAKAICIDFGLAAEYKGMCYLRFDDTNPIKEEEEFVHAIIEDVHWLGFDWQDRMTHASDYFQQLYDYALALIKAGKAYVDSMTAEEMREHRGTLTQAGRESPYRNRSIDENLDLFTRMKAGEFKEGEHILRAKIDMNAGNMNLRDPAIYRIRFVNHQRTGDQWCIYPMYDFAHPLSDAIEGITHSLCSLEFQDHRPLYDWLIENVGSSSRPRQIEFARLNISHTITSKRKLRYLVEENHVDGWDDPRMPTLKAVRRRGYPAAAIRHFCEMTGVSKSNSVIDMSVLEECVRDQLNRHAPRAMAVLNPLKIIIENFAENSVETLSAANHPNDETAGKRELPFARELFIERDDFMQEPTKDFFRLAPGKEVRLRNAYVIKCEKAITDAEGNVLELRCSYDANTLGKNPEGRKVKGVIHWVSAQHAQKAEIRLYDRLFTIEDPAAHEDFVEFLNPYSLQFLQNCLLEPSLIHAKQEQQFQFERQGYFVVDKESNADHLIFNRVVSLRDSWGK